MTTTKLLLVLTFALWALPVCANTTMDYECTWVDKDSGSLVFGQALKIHHTSNGEGAGIYTIGTHPVYPGAKERIIEQAKVDPQTWRLTFEKSGYFASDQNSVILLWNETITGACLPSN